MTRSSGAACTTGSTTRARSSSARSSGRESRACPRRSPTAWSTAVSRLREQGDLYKLPGVGETIVWAQALLPLGDDADLEETLGVGAEGPRGRGAGAARGSPRRCLSAGRAGDASTAGWPRSRRALRAQGSRVGMGELLTAHRALAAVDCISREDAKLALRAVLCSDRGRPRALRVRVRWRCSASGAPPGDSPLDELGAIERGRCRMRRSRASAAPAAGGSEPTCAGPGRVERRRAAAPQGLRELHRRRDGDRPGADRAAGAAGTDPAVPPHAPRPPARPRARPATMVRASLRTGGEPIAAPLAGARRRPRPVVLVCDVSGSMTPYARMLLQYMHASVAARRRVEAFAFGTRLTRITHELGGRDHDRALERATEAVLDFSGGTRIGDALADAEPRARPPGGRGAVVVILSDGWDRGDPEELGSEMARLRRSAHRLVWLNPLAAHPEFAPLTRGMRAAIPHTDELLAGNSLASLEQLAVILEEI